MSPSTIVRSAVLDPARDLESVLSAGADVRVERRQKPGRSVIVSFYAGTGVNAAPDIYRGLLTTAKVH